MTPPTVTGGHEGEARSGYRKVHRSHGEQGMMGTVTRGDVNRNPRRWTDGSARVRVIEGWHPSQPDRLGYNLLVDGDWVGTFDTLDGAAKEAGRHLQWPGMRARGRREVVLVPQLKP